MKSQNMSMTQGGGGGEVSGSIVHLEIGLQVPILTADRTWRLQKAEIHVGLITNNLCQRPLAQSLNQNSVSGKCACTCILSSKNVHYCQFY